MLGPATQQHKSATIIHTSCSSLASPPPPHPSRLSQSVRWGPLCNTATSHPVWDGYLTPESVYMLTLLSPAIPLSPFPLCPQVHFLCLRLHSFPANRFINSIFLDSIYIYIKILYLFFSFGLTSLCRSIHLPRADSDFMAKLYICPASLSNHLLLDICVLYIVMLWKSFVVSTACVLGI